MPNKLAVAIDGLKNALSRKDIDSAECELHIIRESFDDELTNSEEGNKIKVNQWHHFYLFPYTDISNSRSGAQLRIYGCSWISQK